MENTEVFDKLKELQDVLAEKYVLEEKIEESPRQLDSQEELLSRLRKEYIEKNSVYEEIKKSIVHLKEELNAAVTSRETGERNMDEISTHREYEALDKQITEAKEKEANVRAELLKEEKRREDLYESLKIDEETIASLDSELKSKRDALEGQVAEYKSQLDELKEKEESIVPDLNKEDPEIVYKFQRIIKRNSEGIVAVERGVCMGCHMILPAQFANEVRDGEKVLFCPYCSRILFYQESEDGDEDRYIPSDDTGSLVDDDDELMEDEDMLEEDEETSEESPFGDESDKSFVNGLDD